MVTPSSSDVEGKKGGTMRRTAMLLLIGAMAAAACSAKPSSTSTAPSTPMVSDSSAAPPPSPSPEPEKAKPVLLRGAYNGTCTLLKSSGNVEFPAHQSFRWHFQPGASKVLLTSKTGGYTMKLARRTKTKFYGSVNTGGGWQFTYTITASHVADNGVASKIHAITHDTAIGGTASDSYACDGGSD